MGRRDDILAGITSAHDALAAVLPLLTVTTTPCPTCGAVQQNRTELQAHAEVESVLRKLETWQGRLSKPET